MATAAFPGHRTHSPAGPPMPVPGVSVIHVQEEEPMFTSIFRTVVVVHLLLSCKASEANPNSSHFSFENKFVSPAKPFTRRTVSVFFCDQN